MFCAWKEEDEKHVMQSLVKCVFVVVVVVIVFFSAKTKYTVMYPCEHLCHICAFVAESVQLVHDFRAVFERVPGPAVSEEAVSFLDAVLMFMRYYEQNKEFDLLTHGMGPGNVMGQKIDHTKTYRGKHLYPQMYMEKMRKIVNSIVVDKTDEYTGKMLKGQEEEKSVPKKAKSAKVTKKKQTGKAVADETSSSEDIEILSDLSGGCSDNENNFSTLTSSWGMSYHPPSKHTSKSKYAKKDNNDNDIVQCIEDMRRRLEKQKRQIERLTSDNEAAKEKLKKWHTRNAPPAMGKLGHGKHAAASIKGFVGSQLAEVADSSEDEKMGKQPDSTNKDGTASDTGSGIFQSSQMPLPYHRRCRIDSDTQSVKHLGNTPNSDNESETEIDRLLKTKTELEQKFEEMQCKLTEQKMEVKAREYQDHIIVVIRDFRGKLMDYYGAPRSDDRVVKARETFEAEVQGVSQFGYTFRVGEAFVDRVEKSILSGQMPEQQFICTKVDNSEDDPVRGHMVDIIFEVNIPVIVKKEVHDDEEEDKDCLILSVQPAPSGLLRNIKVKEEKVEDAMPKLTEKQKETSCEHDNESGSGGKAEQDMAEDEEEEEEKEEEGSTFKKGTKRGRRKGGVGGDTLPKQRNLRSLSKKNNQDKQK